MDDLERGRLNGIIDCGESGKTSMTATIGIESDFPYVKMISAESMIGLGEATKCAQIVKACSSDEDGLLGFDVHSDGHGQRQLTVLARDERMEITSSMNGAPLFPPKKKYFSCIEMNGFLPLIVIVSQD
ncbi:3-oxoacyl-[acyl-carrier-protein] synthase III, chloroplastic-like [Zingiber officinale]|uniref:3-oxoacyl-[acyl-carrier-protein] synthase III, chloroplastic-like n=1 Tax=Zingiber officinale TaxID=94328 RepID=UPI001C4DB3C7|nr:3-oxoacyl-[acyl-carrier-protein] synthase III, chloroplastic-like [Zingiber officinale]